MRSVRLLLVGVVVAALSAAVAFASSAPVSANRLAAGSRTVAICDPSAASWVRTFTTAPTTGKVTGLTISGIATTCSGGRLSATITDAFGGHVSSAPPTLLPSGAGTCAATCSQPLTFATPQYPADIARLYLVVTGP